MNDPEHECVMIGAMQVVIKMSYLQDRFMVQHQESLEYKMKKNRKK